MSSQIVLPRTFLHIFFIGSASSSDSQGQIPDHLSASEFIENRPTKQCYFYFVDPMHFYRPEDVNRIIGLMDAGASLTIVNRQFDPAKLMEEYKVLDGDEVLLVDCAPIMKCERD